jgi:hypothetical protein
MKAEVKGKLIALSASKKKLEKAYTSSLTAHLNTLEQRMQIHPRGADRKKDANSGLKSTNRNNRNYTKNQQNQELVL